MNIVQRYNLQKGKNQNYYDTPIDKFIAHRLKIKQMFLQQQEQKAMNKELEKVITEKVENTFKKVFK